MSRWRSTVDRANTALLAALTFALILLAASPARSQNVICPTAPPGTSNNQCASTAFVQGAIGTANLVIGTSTITGGTTGRVLYDNAGLLGEYTQAQLTAQINLATASLSGALPAWPNNTTTFLRGDGTYTQIGNAALVNSTITLGSTVLTLGGATTSVSGLSLVSPAASNLTVTGSFTATGLVTNADLANAATTVNGQTCTLGSTCTVTAVASSLVVGSTAITSGTTTRILYDNAGTLGEYTITGSGTVVAMQTSPSLITPVLGVATGTSLAIGGATLGANALAVAGTTLLTGQETINLNSAAAPTPATGTGVQLVGTDATIARYEADSFGAISAFTVRRANGTAASPTALASADQIGSFNFHGYYVTGGPAYSGVQASVQGFASQNWTSTNLGTKVVISTTPNNSTTLTTALTVDQDQSVTAVGSLVGAKTATLGTNGATGGQLTLNGSTSGSAVLKVAAAAGSGIVFTFPSANGTSGQFLQTDGAGVTSWQTVSGSGTVTSITCAATLTCTAANPIVASGTIALNLNNANTWTAIQTFTNSDIKLLGSSTGATTFTSANSGASNFTLTFPAVTATVTVTIASGTSALGTGAISSATCATVVTTSATGTLTTDTIQASFNGDPTAVTGYVPLTTGMLTIIGYPTADNVNWKVCNNTASSITPGAITLNWRVAR